MNKTETEPKETGKKKHGIWRVFLRILAFLLALAVITGAGVFLYSRYTKTHYKITFINIHIWSSI